MSDLAKGEYQMQLKNAYLLIGMVHNIPVKEMLEDISKAEVMGPLLDPTLWISNRQKMAEDKSVLEALLPVWKIAETIKSKTQAESVHPDPDGIQ